MEKSELRMNVKKLAQQEKQLRELEGRVTRLTRTRRRSGPSPLRLALLAAGAYYLWRNERARSRVLGLLDRVNPSLRGNLEQVGETVREGVQSVRNGEHPSEVVKETVQKAQETLSKAASNAPSELRRVANDVHRDADKALRDAQQAASDFSGEVQRKLDDEQRLKEI